MKDISVLNSRLTKLDLSNQNLTEIPKEVFRFKRLRVLKLSGNKLKKLPPELASLSQLERLDLSNNQITVLHASIGKLSNLKVLNLNNNKVKNFPKQIDFTTLEVLSIANNRFKDETIDFSDFINIKKLNISGNLLTKFPYTRGNTFEKLEYLWMNNLMLYDINNLVAFVQRKIASLKGIYAYSSKIETNDKIIGKIANNKGNSLRLIMNNDLLSQSNISDGKNESSSLINIEKMNSEVSKIKIFISYSHADSKWLNKVQKHLKVLRLEKDSIEVWDDTQIKSGDKWEEKIKKALNDSNIAILLISTDFLASDFITDNELPPLLKAAEEKGTKILPLIVKPCRFTYNKEISQFQAVNDPQKALSKCSESEVDEELVKLTESVENWIM
nr:leucine-rich repeat domain-containing protein [uncultured Carboxylicivirga sp.]